MRFLSTCHVMKTHASRIAKEFPHEDAMILSDARHDVDMIANAASDVKTRRNGENTT